jgi:hypothetical protein
MFASTAARGTRTCRVRKGEPEVVTTTQHELSALDAETEILQRCRRRLQEKLKILVQVGSRAPAQAHTPLHNFAIPPCSMCMLHLVCRRRRPSALSSSTRTLLRLNHARHPLGACARKQVSPLQGSYGKRLRPVRPSVAAVMMMSLNHLQLVQRKCASSNTCIQHMHSSQPLQAPLHTWLHRLKVLAATARMPTTATAQMMNDCISLWWQQQCTNSNHWSMTSVMALQRPSRVGLTR